MNIFDNNKDRDANSDAVNDVAAAAPAPAAAPVVDYSNYYQSSCYNQPGDYDEEETVRLRSKTKKATTTATATATSTSIQRRSTQYGSVEEQYVNDANDDTQSLLFEDDLDHPSTVIGRNKLHRRRLFYIGSASIIFYTCNAFYYNNRASNPSVLGSVLSKEVAAAAASLMGSSAASIDDSSFIPTAYPDCPSGVTIRYVSEKLSFDDHEESAIASNCHLASIHTSLEDDTLTLKEFFELSTGTEIGNSMINGKILEKTFWLGGQSNDESDWDDDESWTWTDHSIWDFGPDEFMMSSTTNANANTTTATSTTSNVCLSSTMDTTKISTIKASSTTSDPDVDLPLTTTGEWKGTNCNEALPAIYKCCIPTPSPTLSPSESIEPSVVPTSLPTLSPTLSPTISSKPSMHPSTTPSDVPSSTPSVSPSTTSPSVPPSTSSSTNPSVSRPTTTSPSVSPSSKPSAIWEYYVNKYKLTDEPPLPVPGNNNTLVVDDDNDTTSMNSTTKPTAMWEVYANKYKNGGGVSSGGDGISVSDVDDDSNTATSTSTSTDDNDGEGDSVATNTSIPSSSASRSATGDGDGDSDGDGDGATTSSTVDNATIDGGDSDGASSTPSTTVDSNGAIDDTGTGTGTGTPEGSDSDNGDAVVPIATTKPTELWEYYVNKYSNTNGTPETGDDEDDDDDDEDEEEDDDDTDDSTSPSSSTTTHEDKKKEEKEKKKEEKKKKKEEKKKKKEEEPNYWDVNVKDHKGYTPPEEEEADGGGDDDKHKHKHDHEHEHEHKKKKEKPNGCCSRDFKTCASGEGDSTEQHCDMQYHMKWLSDGPLEEDDKCKARYIPCTRDKHSCCPGLKCKGNYWFKQCTHPKDHGP
jgi:hypothetical protein